jgi:glycosyltransferase involved in cell wall biosynthesis
MENIRNKTCRVVSVVIPTYNENRIILETIRECMLSLNGIGYEIIIVDDGSNDGTLEKVQQFAREQKNIKIVNYGGNHGKGFAIRYGFKHTTGDTIAFIDADMNIHPEQILTFIKEMESTGADVVVGSKRHPFSKVNYPLNRKILSEFYYMFVKMLFDLHLRDTQVGLKLFKRKVLEDVCPIVLVKRYAFDIEILANAHRLGYKIREAPIEINLDYDSHVNKRAIWNMLWDTCAIFYRMSILQYYDKKMENMENKINIFCENKNDMEIIYMEISKTLNKLGNERKLVGNVQYE